MKALGFSSLEFKGLRAFSLVEVTAALGIFTTTMLLLVGLVPTGVQSNRDTFDDTQAANLASLVVADLRSAGSIGSKDSPILKFNVGNLHNASDSAFPVRRTYYFSETFDPSASLDNHTSGVGSQYRADFIIRREAPTSMAPQLEVNLTVSWPAQLDPNIASEQAAINGQYSIFFTIPNPNAIDE